MEENYRNLCQVFTPKEIACKLLDLCDYNENLYGKKVIENSCGDGQILKEIIRRYIDDCLKKNIDISSIRKGLNRDIYAIEYDSVQYNRCIGNLNKILNNYKIRSIKWDNILNEDALKISFDEKFDYVIGNPPYIKYKSLTIADRKFIKDNYMTCQNGKFDYCYAFIELSVNSLKNGGKMAYLIPNSIFKNVFADRLREFLKPHIVGVYDFSTIKLFGKSTNAINKDRLVSSIIMAISKNSNEDDIDYEKMSSKEKKKISKRDLNGKWVFGSNHLNKSRRFGDYYKVSNTIATLYNNAYVIKDYDESDDKYIYLANGDKIEKAILRNTISPKTFKLPKSEKLIFPYYYDNGILCHYETDEFEKKFKFASMYLRKFEKELAKRKSEKSTKWFEYGRSQALKNSDCEKLLLSTIITNNVKTKILSKDNIPYSGIYIVPIKNKDLKYAEEILKSKKFYDYICGIGINTSSSSIRITSKDISDYTF